MPRKKKRKGRVWTEEQRKEMSEMQRKRHETDPEWHTATVKGLEKARAAKRLPFTTEWQRNLYDRVRWKLPVMNNKRQREMAIKMILESTGEEKPKDILRKVEKVPKS